MTDSHFPPVRAGDRISDAAAARIYSGVVNRSLPRPEWTHQAHLVFAAMLLFEKGLAGAEAAAPALIRAYNESVGGVNDDQNGYHHTITLFFLRAIDNFLAPHAGESPALRATRLLASPLAATDYPLQFYTRDRLFSVAARRDYVAPDLVGEAD